MMRIFLDKTEFTGRLMRRDGVKNLKRDMESEEGGCILSTVDVNLSDLDGSVSELLQIPTLAHPERVPRSGVKVNIIEDGVLKFSGTVAGQTARLGYIGGDRIVSFTALDHLYTLRDVWSKRVAATMRPPESFDPIPDPSDTRHPMSDYFINDTVTGQCPGHLVGVRLGDYIKYLMQMYLYPFSEPTIDGQCPVVFKKHRSMAWNPRLTYNDTTGEWAGGVDSSLVPPVSVVCESDVVLGGRFPEIYPTIKFGDSGSSRQREVEFIRQYEDVFNGMVPSGIPTTKNAIDDVLRFFNLNMFIMPGTWDDATKTATAGTLYIVDRFKFNHDIEEIGMVDASYAAVIKADYDSMYIGKKYIKSSIWRLEKGMQVKTYPVYYYKAFNAVQHIEGDSNVYDYVDMTSALGSQIYMVDGVVYYDQATHSASSYFAQNITRWDTSSILPDRRIDFVPHTVMRYIEVYGETRHRHKVTLPGAYWWPHQIVKINGALYRIVSLVGNPMQQEADLVIESLSNKESIEVDPDGRVYVPTLKINSVTPTDSYGAEVSYTYNAMGQTATIIAHVMYDKTTEVHTGSPISCYATGDRTETLQIPNLGYYDDLLFVRLELQYGTESIWSDIWVYAVKPNSN